MKKNTIIAIIVLVIIVIIAVIVSLRASESSAEYKELATCIEESGATFYGAFWCPHCIEQKRLFKGGANALPYVECSTPNRQGQTEECIDAGIESYPTWEFADGERLTGAHSLETLAGKTGCELPLSDEVEA